MKKTLIGITVAAMTLGSFAVVVGQSKPQGRTGTAENRLISVSLFDTGAKVVSIYGSPDDIQALSPGGNAAGGGAGGGDGRGAAPTGGGRSEAPGSSMGGGEADNGSGTVALVGDPFGDEGWYQARTPRGNGGGQATPPGGGGGGGAGAMPPPGGDGGGGGAAGGGAAGGGAAGGNGTKVIYTRWVYKRNNSRYAFVLDKFNRVIQIEAIGMKNSSVKTRRGITFGSSFASVIKAYNAPDSYEVNGDNLVVRFLVRDRVAFRMNRLQKDKPQVVTGVVVAAGKT